MLLSEYLDTGDVMYGVSRLGMLGRAGYGAAEVFILLPRYRYI